MDNNLPTKGTSTPDRERKPYRPGDGKVTGTDTSRRQLAKAGLAVPVIMSLSARPVWASSNGPCSLSGDIFSANLSNIDRECTEGWGCTPGFWRNNLPPWDSTPYSAGVCTVIENGKCRKLDATQGTQFFGVFGFTPQCGGGATTLMEVLQDCPGSLDWHAVGAVLNASSSLFEFGSTVQQVVDAYAKVRLEGFDAETLKEVFDKMNNRGCPINAHGNCEDGYSNTGEANGDSGYCIPVVTSGG